MYNGILPVYKERGLTSHDVVFKLRKILKTKKVGHTGTLDPEVSGVLPICIGDATKVSDYVMNMGKTYEATVCLGSTTTTEDQTGEVIERVNIEKDTITSTQIDDVLVQFQGVITQVPPMYSSVKVNGKKLYEYARNNQVVERPERQVVINQISRTSGLRFEHNDCEFDIIVSCGKGTYIRTLATDIGKALGLPAHMSKLTRTQSGGFDLKESLSLEAIQTLHEQDALQEKLFPIEYGLKGLKQIVISDDEIKGKILNGQKFNKAQFEQNIDEIVIMVDDTTQKVLAIYEPHPEKIHEIKPKKVFN
ncbi:tRNA pseudouridine(55) synthase TruB [Staphylococcus caeli]|uniref:tRNA pseudouridine(55) synthase TruB n=1 Tax=Staphylococcus caeli TaxID=2201815 RepID=UPI003F54A695